jgi:uncharacterized Tic20 family protein
VSTSHPSEEPLPEQSKDAPIDAGAAQDAATDGQPAAAAAPPPPAAEPAPPSEATTPPPPPPGSAASAPPPTAEPAPPSGAPVPPPGPEAAPAPPPPPPGAASPGYGAVPPPVMGPDPSFGAPPAQPQVGVRYNVPQDQKNLALISTLGMLIVGFLSPLIVFVLTNGDQAKRFANDHAKEGLNFSIVFFGGWIVAFLLAFVIIGFLLMPLLVGWGLWVIIAGAIQASNGEAPHYPLVPKILK